MSQELSMILSLLGVVVVLIITYYGTKLIAKNSLGNTGSSYMKIIDKMSINQGASLLIVEIDSKYFLISVSEKNIQIMKELEDFELVEEVENNSCVPTKINGLFKVNKKVTSKNFSMNSQSKNFKGILEGILTKENKGKKDDEEI